VLGVVSEFLSSRVGICERRDRVVARKKGSSPPSVGTEKGLTPEGVSYGLGVGFLVSNNWTPSHQFFISVHSKGS